MAPHLSNFMSSQRWCSVSSQLQFSVEYQGTKPKSSSFRELFRVPPGALWNGVGAKRPPAVAAAHSRCLRSSASPLWCFAEQPRTRESEWGLVYVGDLEEGSWGSAIRLTLTPNLRREDTKSKGGTGIHKKTPDRAYLDAHAPRVSGSPQSTLVLCRVLRIGNHCVVCV